MGITNHHRTGEVLMEVINIFTHSNKKWKNKINSTNYDSLKNNSKKKTPKNCPIPVSEASRHADVVKQNQMLHKLAEADTPRMRANRN